jgi:hypothetical protein
MKKDYCKQNDHNCQTCALSSYGKDCLNNKIIDGGMNELYNRKADGTLYQLFVDGKLTLTEDAPIEEITYWPPTQKAVKKVHGVDGWCNKCQSWCFGDCGSA